MNLLVISPHPDDETLGAGGTMLKFKNLGHKVFWLNVTNMKAEYGFDPSRVEKRGSEIRGVMRAYGLDGFFDLGLKPAGLDCCEKREVIENISALLDQARPDAVFLPFENDIHSDHRVVFQAAFSSAKVFRHPYIKRVLMMEILSETDLVPESSRFAANCFVDVSDTLERKIEIMKIYSGEMQSHPFPRSEEGIRALAVSRGAQAGCRYAEAFRILRWIE